MKAYLCFTVLLLSAGLIHAQENKLSGIIYDQSSKVPLAFVSVVIKESKKGAVTDIDGHFSFANAPVKSTLIISYVGYKTKQLEVDNSNGIELSISLEQSGAELENVTVSSAENPAHRIIRLMQRNKTRNDPEQQPSFRYNAYTIAALGSGDKFWNRNRNDSALSKQQKSVPVNTKKMDTSGNARNAMLAKRLKENYLMLMESYTERIFKYPALSKETVIATRVSGIDNPVFAATGRNFQPFGFYKEYLEMNNINYVSPVADGSISMYAFRLRDVLIHEKDTTFIISFAPRKGKNFNGLKGMLYINSDHYALEDVIASPADERGLIFSFRLQQKYERLNDNWFPVQFNSTLTQKDIRTDSILLYWDTRCYVSNVEIGQPISRTKFSNVQLDFQPMAGKRSDSAWVRMRSDTLTEKERMTYGTFEMMPKKFLGTMNKANKVIQVLALEALPWKKVDIPFRYILSGINKYETFRLGGGFQTNSLLSKYISFGGFAGYGFKDKAWKYGGNISVNMDERTGTKLRFSYARDITEPGNVDYFTKNGSVFAGQTLRNFQTSRMDSIEQLKLDFSTRITPSLQADVWMLNEHRGPAGYDYTFVDNTTGVSYRNFQNTELGIGLRYTRGENYIMMGRAKVRNAPAKTQLLFQVSKGMKNVFNGDLDYTRAAIQFNHSFKLKKLGVTSIQLEAGQVWGKVPYSYLFNEKASKTNRQLSVFVPNTFQTVGLYEFTASKSAGLFIQHSFGNLLFKPKSISTRPELILVQGIGYGSLDHAAFQKNLQLKVAEKGLFESGLLIKNIYRTSIMNLAYVGFGGGVFYRYGHYALSKAGDNWAFKWGFNISF